MMSMFRQAYTLAVGMRDQANIFIVLMMLMVLYGRFYAKILPLDPIL